jgi:hypothetical protein
MFKNPALSGTRFLLVKTAPKVRGWGKDYQELYVR